MNNFSDPPIEKTLNPLYIQPVSDAVEVTLASNKVQSNIFKHPIII